ncbi:MAG: hemolysin III, partial [Acidimicrobiia bacterium]|nr:hemolysin III [Acidimicrobiia bacterium]
LKLLLPVASTGLSITLQMVMGWSALIWAPSLVRTLGWGPMVLILVGGLAYSVGVVIFTTKRPRLFPRVFSYHEVFHILVIAGSAFHYVAVATLI